MTEKSAHRTASHKAALWGMVLPLGYLTAAHLGVFPFMIAYGLPEARKTAILLGVFLLIALAWKCIITFDKTEGWSKKRLLMAGWATLTFALLFSPFIGKGGAHFLWRQ